MLAVIFPQNLSHSQLLAERVVLVHHRVVLVVQLVNQLITFNN